MPVDKSQYPAHWDEISKRIRERAGDRCEWCGVRNGVQIMRSAEDSSRFIYVFADFFSWPDGTLIRYQDVPQEFADNGRYIKVILTVAHLGVDHPDGTPGNKHDKMDVRDENLAALCQRCHLNYDRDEHQFNRRRTKRIKVRERGQHELWPEWWGEPK